MLLGSRTRLGFLNRISVFLLWWCLVGGGIVSFFLKTQGVWFDGFDLFNAIVLPTALALTFSGCAILAVVPAARFESCIAYMMWLAVAVAVASRLDYLMANATPELFRGIVSRPLIMFMGYLIGFVIGRVSQLPVGLFQSRYNLLVILSFFYGLAITLAHHSGSFARVGGGHVFAFGDSLIYVGIGFLAPLFALRKWAYALIGLAGIEGLLFLAGIRGNIVSFNVSMFGTFLLVLLNRNRASAQVSRQSTPRSQMTWHLILLFLVVGVGLVYTGKIAGFGRWLESLLQRGNVLWRLAPSSDQSFLRRLEELDYGFGVVGQTPARLMVGVFAYEDFSIGTGEYIHNFLSILAEFGLPAFCLALVLWAVAFKTITELDLNELANIDLVWFFLHWSVAFVLFRVCYTVHFWVALGAMLGARHRLRMTPRCRLRSGTRDPEVGVT